MKIKHSAPNLSVPLDVQDRKRIASYDATRLRKIRKLKIVKSWEL